MCPFFFGLCPSKCLCTPVTVTVQIAGVSAIPVSHANSVVVFSYQFCFSDFLCHTISAVSSLSWKGDQRARLPEMRFSIRIKQRVWVCMRLSVCHSLCCRRTDCDSTPWLCPGWQRRSGSCRGVTFQSESDSF